MAINRAIAARLAAPGRFLPSVNHPADISTHSTRSSRRSNLPLPDPPPSPDSSVSGMNFNFGALDMQGYQPADLPTGLFAPLPPPIHSDIPGGAGPDTGDLVNTQVLKTKLEVPKILYPSDTTLVKNVHFSTECN